MVKIVNEEQTAQMLHDYLANENTGGDGGSHKNPTLLSTNNHETTKILQYYKESKK